MSVGPVVRRLAAIVVADVADYSRLMEADEAGTYNRLRAIRSDVVDPTTATFRGRIVKGTGDGWLAEFSSVTDALMSTVAIQEEVSRWNARFDPEPSVELRVGINLGEIIIDGDDIYGTGVNIAARLESIAEPGGICISDLVYQQVHSALPFEYEDMGPQTVKNIAEPIRAFAVRPGRGRERRTPTVRGEAASTPTGASIAILPFSNLSGDPAQDYFVDGMVEDLLTALSRFKWLTVVARASTLSYKGRGVDVRHVARELGVRYVLEGSVQKADRRVRLTGQLIDAASGAHLWADRFEGYLEDIFDFQDRMTEQVVSALEPQIRRAEIERARRVRPENLDAYVLYLRALPKVYAMRPQENKEALDLLQEALHHDPGYAPALAFAAWCYEQRLTRHWPEAREDDPVKAVELARRALTLQTDDANVISISGFVLVMVGHDYEPGLAALARAVELNPHNQFALMNWAWANTFADDLNVAQATFEHARSLSRDDPAAYFVYTGLAMTHFLAGRFDQAVEMATASLKLYEDWEVTSLVLASALAGAGRLDEAAQAMDRLKRLLPGATVDSWLGGLPIRDSARLSYWEHYARAAGLPDCVD